MKHYPAMSYKEAHSWESEAKKRGVSKVARSQRGFMRAYERAGSFSKLPQKWKDKRNAFIARHMAQADNEDLWKKGKPSRRALALIMWAYMPPGRRSNPPQRIAVGEDGVARQIATLAVEIASFDPDTLMAVLNQGPLQIRFWDGYEDGALVWGLFDRQILVGAGNFTHVGDALLAKNQAILSAYQRRGIYRRILKFVRGYADPLPVQSDGQQTAEASAVWRKMGAVDMGGYYELPPIG